MTEFSSRSRRPAGRPASLASCEFAVLDLETTGFNALGNDRIVEIAVVHVGPDHRIQAEYCSLVNPGRDLGATHIHGITGSDMREAPSFVDVADDLIAWLAGRVIVAHNAPFDLRFLHAEFARLGHELPELAAVDTLALTGLRLDLACRSYGVDLRQAHTALGDARATAGLFRALLETRFRGASDLEALGCSITLVPVAAWPRLPFDATERRRPPRSRSVPGDELPSIEIVPGMTVCFTGEPRLWFEGEPLTRTVSRELWEAAGLAVRSNVSRKLTYLVAADPDSLSGKARLARERGIPIITHDVFWRALGIAVVSMPRP